MESINNNQFNFVYLDVPWFTGMNDFNYSFSENNDDTNLELIEYLAKLKNCNAKDISLNELKEERLKRRSLKEKADIDLYGSYIAKILENAMRILDSKGMLVFRAPINSVIDYKLMLDQVFSNTYVMQITLEKRKRPMLHTENVVINHETLYFYSKSKEYKLNKVYEKLELYKDQYPYKDEKDSYKLIPLMRGGSVGRYDFTWRAISSTDHLKWICKEEKLEDLYSDNRVVIKGEKAYKKSYLKENPREKSSVWKANLSWSSFFNINEKPSFTMTAENFIDLINMVTNENDWIFAPYDYDQKMPVIAQNMNRNWVTINSFIKEEKNYKEFLSKEYDEIFELEGITDTRIYNKLLKNIDDINDLKFRLKTLNTSVADIKNQLGLDSENEEVIIEKIQEKIDELIEKSDIEYYIPVVQNWIKPYWDKLENESRWFLPTAELLFHEYKETNDFDLSTAIMPYCKSLEKEIFTKMFKGYVKDLIVRGINVHTKFKKDFNEYETKKFVEAIKSFTTRFKNNDSKWHFELGTMVYVLKIVLKGGGPFLKEDRIYRDLKNYLEKQFELSFFDVGFLLKLDDVVRLRNDSAHPQIVTPERVKEGKEITKQKIIELLKFYNG